MARLRTAFRPWSGSMRAVAGDQAAGFSLLDALLSACIGSVLAMALLQSLLADARITQRFSRQIHERQNQTRLFDLLRSDLRLASGISPHPELEAPVCSLAGRQPVLHLSTSSGPITYSVGPPPSAIWRGQVLVRCGPAYGLDGTVSMDAIAVSRVVLDGLRSPLVQSQGCPALLNPGEVAQELNRSGRTGLVVCLLDGGTLLAVALEQSLPLPGGTSSQLIRQEQLLGLGL